MTRPTPAIGVDDQSTGPFIGVWATGSAGEVAQLNQLGVAWTRTIALWEVIQPSNNNTFNFANLDAEVNALSGGGQRKVLVMVRNNPAWAATSRCRVSTDAERARLADFLTVLVNRYKDRVKYWQLYNEMDNTSEAFDQQFDLGGCFGTASNSTPTQEGRDNYARMLETVGAAIHAADPQAKVIMGAIVSGNYLTPATPTRLFDADFGPGVLARLKANNTLDRLDYMAIHFFSSQSIDFNGFNLGPDLVGRVTKLRVDMRAAGLTEEQLKPILVDEGSYTGMIGTSTGDPNNPFNVAQRDYAAKALVRAAASDLVAYYWFALQDGSGGLGSENAYGLISNAANGSIQKPSFKVVQNFQSLFTRQDQYIGRLSLQDTRLEGHELVTNDGRQVQIIWNEVDTQTVNLPLPFGPGSTITDATGAAVAASGGNVTVGPEPRYIFSPSCTGRPNVSVAVAPASGNRLQVTVTANSSAGAPNNRLTRLHFDSGTNTLVDIPGGQTGATGSFDVGLPTVPSTTFFLRRANPNVTNATVPLKVFDGCGAWSTFVGGGASAWAAASQAASSESQPAAPAPAPVACAPRPEIKVTSVPDGSGRLRVTVSATGAGNSLHELRFANPANALIDVGDHTGASGALTVTLPANTEQTSFVVRRATPDQSTTVPLNVVDGCGAWPTMVGGGASAF